VERSAPRYYATGQPRALRSVASPDYLVHLEPQQEHDEHEFEYAPGGPLPFPPSTPSAVRAALPGGGGGGGGLISPAHLSASRRRSSLSSYGSSSNSFSDIFPCDLAVIPLPASGKEVPKGTPHASRALDDFAEHANAM
jgi:hypothetical protein